MSKSILQPTDKKFCYICGQTEGLERHHCFGGANRIWSEAYGLWVYLCHYCHNEPPSGIHFDKKMKRALQGVAQALFEKTYPGESFRQIFGRNYQS